MLCVQQRVIKTSVPVISLIFIIVAWTIHGTRRGVSRKEQWMPLNHRGRWSCVEIWMQIGRLSNNSSSCMLSLLDKQLLWTKERLLCYLPLLELMPWRSITRRAGQNIAPYCMRI